MLPSRRGLTLPSYGQRLGKHILRVRGRPVRASKAADATGTVRRSGVRQRGQSISEHADATSTGKDQRSRREKEHFSRRSVPADFPQNQPDNGRYSVEQASRSPLRQCISRTLMLRAKSLHRGDFDGTRQHLRWAGHHHRRARHARWAIWRRADVAFVAAVEPAPAHLPAGAATGQGGRSNRRNQHNLLHGFLLPKATRTVVDEQL